MAYSYYIVMHAMQYCPEFSFCPGRDATTRVRYVYIYINKV